MLIPHLHQSNLAIHNGPYEESCCLLGRLQEGSFCSPNLLVNDPGMSDGFSKHRFLLPVLVCCATLHPPQEAKIPRLCIRLGRSIDPGGCKTIHMQRRVQGVAIKGQTLPSWNEQSIACTDPSLSFGLNIPLDHHPTELRSHPLPREVEWLWLSCQRKVDVDIFSLSLASSVTCISLV